MEPKYKCQFCGQKHNDVENMAYTKEDGSYDMCWDCWDQQEQEKEDALAALD